MDPVWGNGGIYLGGGGETIENMSDDARTRFRVSARVSTSARSHPRVHGVRICLPICVSLCLCARGQAGRLFLKCVCVHTVGGGVGVKLVPALL